jgi:class 3 adenylate cyclase
MEPRIQYAKTSDGVSIAYCVLGEGTPLVYASNVWGDLQWYLHDDASRRGVDALVESGWKVIRYDGRGSGSSQRDVTDFSLEGRVRDLQAVVDHVGIEPFVLCGYGQGGPPAIAWSVEHPERVSHLALINSFASGSAYYDRIPAMRALINLRSMAQEQWEFFTITLASAATGFRDAARAKATAQLFRRSMSPEAFISSVDASRQSDVSELLPRVRVTSLVVADSSGFDTEGLSRHLASSIPGACFVATDDYTKELHAFVLDRTMEKRAAPLSASATAVILFADIADSTPLTERLGDAAFREKARAVDEALRSAICEHGGTPVEGKLLGDGVLATFASAKDAIDAALACGEAGGHAGLPLHLGIHAGDVIREDDNVFGGAVTIASRISDLAPPGEVLVSQTVRDLARTSAGVSFEDRGERELKGVGDLVRLYAVRRNE